MYFIMVLCGQDSASVGIESEGLATDINTVRMGSSGTIYHLQGCNVPKPEEGGPSFVSAARAIFFFASRRRHTRLQGDWSSDVCSSDLFPLPRTACHWLRKVAPSYSQSTAQ